MLDLQPTLEGPTLRLRPVRADDFDALFGVASDPQLWAVHPAHDRWQKPVFRAFFDEGLASGGMLAVEDIGSGRLIGSSRYQRQPDSLEIGWTFLARSHWGGATNRELKRLMLAHALAHEPRVTFRVGENNGRSRRAMEKVGARLTDQIERREMAGETTIHVIYEIDREGFANGALSAGA